MFCHVGDDQLLFVATLKNADQAEAVLCILDTLGYTLRRIRTSGEHSSHDGTYSFDREYASYADFAANVHADFAAETERYKSAATVDWSHTRFELTQPADWDVRLFMRKEEEHQSCPNVAYFSIEQKEATDKALLEQLLTALDAYLEK